MLSRVLAGAVAGAVATIPQSAVVWGARRASLYRRQPPPEQVAEHLAGVISSREAGPRPLPMDVKLLQHFAFGAACGAAFALASSAVRPTVLAGVAAGIAIWKLSYDGWIPALGIMPPPEHDEPGRAGAIFAAHVAYGLALGALFDLMTRERSDQ